MDKEFEPKKRIEIGKMFARIENAMGSVRSIHKDKAKEVILAAAVFSFSFFVSSAAPMPGVYPFGIALICAMSRFPSALCALSGSLFGLFFSEENVLLYGAAEISVFFIRLALGAFGIVKTFHFPTNSKSAGVRDSPDSFSVPSGIMNYRIRNAFATSSKIKMICALGGALTVSAGMILTKGNLWYDIFAAVFASVTLPLVTFAFASAFDRKCSVGLRKAGAAVFAFAFFLGISPFTLGGMNVGVVLAFLLSMLVSVGFGITDGILFGLFSGMAMEPAFAPMYGIAAAACGALYCFSSGAAAICAAVLGISWALYSDGIAAFSSAVPEILLAASIFYPLAWFRLIPEKVDIFTKNNEYINTEEIITLKKNCSTADKIVKISSAMSHISKVLRNVSQKLKIPSAADCDAICESAFANTCPYCSKRKICHARESFKDGRILKNISESLKLWGRVTIDTFPESMKRGCSSVDTVIEGINREYGKFYIEALKTDKTTVIAEDYGAIAALIKETVATQETEETKNQELTEKLTSLFKKNGIIGEKVSVYGKERPRIFVRGMTVKDLSIGSNDIRQLAQGCVGSIMTEPEMSIDYDRLNLYMECKKRFSFKHGYFSERAGGPEVNGDAAASFVLPDGRFCMLICDGMGSGRDAAITARVSVIFLERMLTAGCPVATALKLLNNFTSERRIECFSTVDLFLADPYTGKAEFIKSGAAPSFVLRGNKLFKMECNAAPVGILKDVKTGGVTFSLEKGDCVIMISDGITGEEENCARLYDVLSSSGCLSKVPFDCAKEILHTSREKLSDGRLDDATVGVIKVCQSAS